MTSLSKKTQYTLRALYALARTYGQGPTLIAKLAEEESIPQPFLEAILLNLKREGLVESKKGKGGGYALTSPPGEVTLGQVIRLVEGPLAPLPCASETKYRRCEECLEDRTCGTKMIMRQVRDATAAILDHTTLAQVCDLIDETSAKLHANDTFMYYI
ncbi:MAG TPA: Rrf2 family transcriptional regulator [Bryobacteraceae bacterium]|nr:Rrf2 family transcriptional regulator [Bryobacteraceae bacterium]